MLVNEQYCEQRGAHPLRASSKEEAGGVRVSRVAKGENMCDNLDAINISSSQRLVFSFTAVPGTSSGTTYNTST
jgi:hypothetical protein